VQRVEAGAPDVPLLVLPLVNDLKAARGVDLLSEAAMLLPDMRLPRDESEREIEQGKLEAAIKKVRQRYMRALLALLRGQDTSNAVTVLAWTFKELRSASSLRSTRMFWLIGRGIADGLMHGTLEPTPAIKSILGQLDRSMKSAHTHGELAFSRSIPTSLLKNMLFYCGRAGDSSDVLKLIRQRYQLHKLMGSETHLAEAKERHSLPSPALIAAARESIDAELGVVKDTVEAFVHNEQASPEELLPLPLIVSRLCDSMTVLALVRSRSLLAEQQEMLQTVADLQRGSAVARLYHFAESLLLVERTIEKELDELQHGSGHVDTSQEIDSEQSSLATLPREEWREMLGCICSELLQLSARFREAYLSYIEPESSDTSLNMVLPQLRDAAGIVTVLPLPSAKDVLAAAGANTRCRARRG